jgi:hypothetical protein
MNKIESSLYLTSIYRGIESDSSNEEVSLESIIKDHNRILLLINTSDESIEWLKKIAGYFRKPVFLDLNSIPEKMTLHQFLEMQSFNFLFGEEYSNAILIDELYDSKMHRLVELHDLFKRNSPIKVFITLTKDKFTKPQSEKEPIVRSILSEFVVAYNKPKTGFFEDLIEKFSHKLYAVTSAIEGLEPNTQFVSKNIWRSFDDTFNNIVNSVSPNDILILNSSFIDDHKKTALRVQGIGKVTSNEKNGVILNVKWYNIGWIYEPIIYSESLLKLSTQSIIELSKNDFISWCSQLNQNDKNELINSGIFAIIPILAPTDHILYRTAICNDFGETDTLNFSRDTKSLAALIALKEMKPPLAIALFGKWGSGKSFFMKMLEKHIKELSENQGFQEKTTAETAKTKPENELFHSGIAHIRFNAWSYMDANLWAGLSHSLFEKLNEYITDNTKGTVEKLKVQVKITKRLDILHSDLNHFKEKRSQLIHLKERLENERESKILTYFKTINYDTTVSGFLKKNGYSDQQIKEMTPSSIKKVIDETINLVSFFRSKGYKRSLITLLIIVSLFIVEGILERTLTSKVDFIKDSWFKIITVLIPLASTGLSFFNKKLKAIKKVEEYLELINPKNLQSKTDEKLNLLHQELLEIDALTKEIQNSITTEYSKTSDLTQLAIANFISVKPEQEDYRKHLGIVTTIRKDFETLSELFADLNEHTDTDSNKKVDPLEESKQTILEQDKVLISESFDENKRLERIILYIDDLDRCSDEKIMDVLEAVHLLMAFPLFIVVVGVDERSVHNALMNRRLERYRGIEKAIVDEYIEPVEPHEYLEKIFQIPFQLPEAKSEHIFSFIDSLVPISNIEEIQEFRREKPQSKSYTFEDGDDPLIVSEPQEMTYNNLGKEEQPADVKEKSTEEKMKHIYITPNDIVITPAEKQLLIDFAPLVGNNPRSLKRYINIFRISKVYSHHKTLTTDRTKEIIFTIALLTGEFDDVAGKWYDFNTLPITSFGKDNEKFQSGLAEITMKESPHYQELLEAPAVMFSNELAFIKRFSYGSQLTKKKVEIKTL